jgi:outer membrane protein assembly factor BamB
MNSENAKPRKPLRLWPGAAAGALLIAGYIAPVIVPAAAGLGMLVGMGAAVVIVVWWLFFSRAPWMERLAALVLMAAAVAATSRVIHMSIAGAGMGMLFPILGLQSMSLALVVWAVASRRMSDGPRRLSLVAVVLFVCGLWTIVRTDGMLSGEVQWAWRWTPTAEERLLAQANDLASLPPPPAATDVPKSLDPPAIAAPPAVPTASAAAKVEPAAPATTELRAERPATSEPGVARAEWPGFRGPERDGIVRGVRIDTDWAASPPVEMWRRPIGPGWSSFAVHGELIYTQEQRGEDEMVTAYSLRTGKAVWAHRDKARFWESNGGAGPRGTPTLSHGRVYALGATGILNALDPLTGRVVWSRSAPSDTKAKVPGWGFSSSPLVVNDVVIVATSGVLAAYDLNTGQTRWTGPVRDTSYSSPHLFLIDGVAHVVLLTGSGATSFAPADGKVLWEHAWPGGAIVQPARTADGDILINSMGMTGGVGTRRLTIARAPVNAADASGGWTVTERWTSNGLKPYFNDFVIHKGHAYGFDGSILASIDLADGKRKWKGGRYGEGQLVLLPDQDLLLVLSEEGELALVSATPDKFTEIARAPAIEGKTWNHPVVVGDVLLVRNGEEMAAFRLSPAKR